MRSALIPGGTELVGAAVAEKLIRSVHGLSAARPREWVFVRRILDGRKHVLLAHAGRGVNHPTAAVNPAALVETCADQPGTRILNSADPDTPSGLDIARTIARHLGHTWTKILLSDDAPDGLGDHPWNTWPPFVLDTNASLRLGYVPVGDYAATVAPHLDALVEATRLADPNQQLPSADEHYFAAFFDFAREDTYLAR